jgi:hypothetical protein
VVNVHNPSNVTVLIQKKAAGALTERDPGPGTISPFKAVELIPDQVLAIDCRDVAALLGGAHPNGRRRDRRREHEPASGRFPPCGEPPRTPAAR